MKGLNRNSGFTLIEVIIAVALVAIMAVAIAPPLVQNLKSGKVARAQSDVQSIGTAVLSFYKDVSDWPMASGSNNLSQVLVGLPATNGARDLIPSGVKAVSGSSSWRTNNRRTTLTDILIRNKVENAELYTVSRNPHVNPGWNGPYLTQVPLDPWGNPYMVNIKYATPAIAGTSTEDYDKHNVMVISSGPNEKFETPLKNDQFDEQVGGDDIGYIFQRASRY
jgi:prepilin-type N-terminal cleavage/methylation domain-containing protein